MTLIEQGHVNVTLNGRTVTCTPGAVILIDTWARHSAHAHDGLAWTSTAYSLPVTALAAAAHTALPGGPPGLRSQVVYDHDVFSALQGLHQHTERAGLLQTLDLLIRRYGHIPQDQPQPSQLVRTVRELFQTQPATSVRLRDLAAALGVSVSHLVRSFHTQVGYSPHEYLLLCRNEHARQRLRAGESLAQTALLCGYYDQSHLTGHFKRTFGITPARYAAAVHARPTSAA